MWFALWALTTAWTQLVAYALTLRLASASPTLERLVLAGFYGQALMLGQVVGLGHAHSLTRPALLTSAWLLGAALLGLCATGDRASMREALRKDLGAPRRLWRESWADLAHLAVLGPALWVGGTALLVAWYYRSWTWDPSWYHVPITNLAIQTGSLAWFDTPNIYTAGYPRAVELLATWHCLLPLNHRLDDAGQLAFAPLGALVVAAWARREGASRGASLGAGVAWFALPPVFLQCYATFVDVAFGASIAGGWYFATGPLTRGARWNASLCFLFAVACKFTGCFHLAMASPLLFGRFLVELYRARGRRLRTFGDALLMLLVLLPVFIEKYVQNTLREGNPFWPYITRLPLFGIRPGAEAPEPVMGAPIGARLYFWGGPEYWERMVRGWGLFNPRWHPTPLEGGYGVVFFFLFLPAVVALGWDALRGRAPARRLALPALLVVAHTVPMPFWTRYTLAGAAASAVAWGLLASQLPGLRRAALGLLLAALTTVMCALSYSGFVVHPRHWAAVSRASWQERSALQIDTFLWPSEWGLAKEREFRAGDVLVYDATPHFLSDLWTYDYRSRVLYVPQQGDGQAFVRRVRELRARWVVLGGGSPADHLLRRAGAQYLFTLPSSGAVALRLRRD